MAVGSARKLHNDGGTKPARMGGPPVQGLYDHPKSPARTSTPLYVGMLLTKQYMYMSSLCKSRTSHSGVDKG